MTKLFTAKEEFAPVVHGRWKVEKEKDTFGFIIHLKCSQCNNCNSERSNYCPHCGAKMDLE